MSPLSFCFCPSFLQRRTSQTRLHTRAILAFVSRHRFCTAASLFVWSPLSLLCSLPRILFHALEIAPIIISNGHETETKGGRGRTVSRRVWGRYRRSTKLISRSASFLPLSTIPQDFCSSYHTRHRSADLHQDDYVSMIQTLMIILMLSFGSPGCVNKHLVSHFGLQIDGSDTN